MDKHLIYADARVSRNKLLITPYNPDDDWKLELKNGDFVGHGDAVWLVRRRGQHFFFVQISEDDVRKYDLDKATFSSKQAAAAREEYKHARGYRFKPGPGIWCRHPTRGDVIWVAGHPRCHSRLDVALTLVNHRTKDVRRVDKISRVVEFDHTREAGELGSRGAFFPEGGVFSAFFRKGSVDKSRQRVSGVEWLIVFAVNHNHWNLEIYATPKANDDDIADAVIDGCGLYEFELFAEMLLKPRLKKRRRPYNHGRNHVHEPKRATG